MIEIKNSMMSKLNVSGSNLVFIKENGGNNLESENASKYE